jgi:glycosyltransferase involved in cell wall biosynthesis
LVKFFFRYHNKGFYSIEELFGNIQKALPVEIHYANHYFSLPGIGLINRIKIFNEAKHHKAAVNHVTGDVHYVAMALPPDKTILTIHDIESAQQGNWLSRAIIKLFWFTLPCKHVRYVTVISETTKKKLLQLVDIPEAKIKVIPNCVSPLIEYAPAEFHTKKPVVLAIGTKSNKNLENQIKALKDISCTLFILGKLSESQMVLLKENEIDYQNFSGLNYPKVIELYKTADMLCFPSLYEGFGMPIVEAQATGRPVITSNISAMPEVAGKGALLVDPYKPEEIKKAILRIMNEPELRNELIAAGLENVKRFKAEVVAEQYAEVYRQIFNDKCEMRNAK